MRPTSNRVDCSCSTAIAAAAAVTSPAIKHICQRLEMQNIHGQFERETFINIIHNVEVFTHFRLRSVGGWVSVGRVLNAHTHTT